MFPTRRDIWGSDHPFRRAEEIMNEIMEDSPFHAMMRVLTPPTQRRSISSSSRGVRIPIQEGRPISPFADRTRVQEIQDDEVDIRV
jgi:hypothetical protein